MVFVVRLMVLLNVTSAFVMYYCNGPCCVSDCCDGKTR